MKRPASSPSPVTAKFVQKRKLDDSCSGRWSAAGAYWCSSCGAAARPRSAARQPAMITVSPYAPASTTPDSRSTASCSGPRCNRLLAGLERVLEHLREQLVLLLGTRVGTEPLRVHVSEVVRHAAGHRAHGREHRALGRVAHRRVGGVRRPRERGRHEHRVDQLARPRRQLLGGAPHHLRQDHAAVAARAEQRGSGDGAHDLVAADVVDGRAVERVQLLEHGAHRERHVVAGVAVRHREHVEVVHLLAPVLQLVQSGGDHASEAREAVIGGHPALFTAPDGAGPR